MNEGETLPVRIFGPAELDVAGRIVPFAPERRFQLIGALALQSGQWVSRDRLAALLWPDHDAADARRNLRHVVFKARELVGGSVLEADEDTLRWTAASDVKAFHTALEHGRVDAAIALRRGPLLDGVEAGAGTEYAAWVQAERSRLDNQWRQEALRRLAALGDQPMARAALAERLIAADPCDEAATTALIELDLADGRHAAAQRRYREFALRLAEQLGIEPSRRLRDLVHPAHAADAAADEAAVFVGRTLELAELRRRLALSRVVVVVGPGGAGKSSLARRAAAALPGGAVWVDLHDLGDVHAVAARIAHRIDVELRDGEDVIAQLARGLGSASRHMVLDNAEQLDGLGLFVERLAAAAPALTLLVTSRRRLAIGGEELLPLHGLALPDEASRDAEAAVAFDAVRLFDARASAAQRGFRVEAHIDAVVDIVCAVGGLPLAIELAASWVRLLPAETIAADLRESIALLERDPATASAPKRPEHTSMQAVLDRALALLAPSDRSALAALTVFAGPFGHDAAREVADVTMPQLSSLVDHSLLAVDEGGRFALHPLVAAAAAARLGNDAAAARRERHARWFAVRLDELASRHPGDQRPIVALLRDEFADARAAWQHGVEARRADLLRPMLPAWRRWFVATGRFDEGRRHLEPALAFDGAQAPAALLAELRAALAWFSKCEQDADAATALASMALDAAVMLGEARIEVDAVNTLGAAELLRGRWSSARAWFERALAAASAQAMRRETATALNNLGLVGLCEGSFDGCAGRFAQAAEMQRELGDHVSATRALHNLGSVHMAEGDWPRARDANHAALRYARAHGAEALVPVIEFMQGATLIELGDLDGAERHLAAALERCRSLGDTAYEVKAEYYLARIAGRRGRHQGAADALAAAARRVHTQGWTYDLLYIALFHAELLHARGEAAAAALLIGSALAHPEADAFVRATAAAAGDATAGVAFDAVVACLVEGADLALLAAKLRPAADKR